MRTFIFSLVLILIPWALASADEFGDFRIPEHSVYSVFGRVYGSHWADRSNYETGSDRSWNYSGQMSGTAYYLWDSDPLRAGLLIYGLLTDSRSSNRRHVVGDTVFSDQTTSKDEDNAGEAWRIQGETRIYPWSIPVGFMLNATGSGSYLQNWSTNFIRESGFGQDFSRHRDDEVWSYYYSVSGTTAMGLGRVRDATTVYKAEVLENRLLKSGALTRALSPAARTRLAQLFVAEKSYPKAHERPLKYFWRDVETILREDGALRDSGLDAYDIYRILEPYLGPQHFFYYDQFYETDYYFYVEPLAMSSYRREKGFFVGLAVQGNHSNRILQKWVREHSVQFNADTLTSDTIINASSRQHIYSDYVSIGIQAEYHRPLGMRWQLDVGSQIMFPQNDDPHAINARTQIHVQYMLADRWSAEFGFSHGRQIYRPRSGESKASASQWAVGTGVSLSYYIEDRLTASLSFGQDQIGAQNPDFAYHPGHAYDRRTSMSVSLNYNFLGRLRIPGLGIDSPLAPLPSGGNWFR